jgi:hypothetical protein
MPPKNWDAPAAVRLDRLKLHFYGRDTRSPRLVKENTANHMRFPEPAAIYALDILSTNKERIRTFSGSTSTGIVKLHWNLTDEQGKRWNGDFFESVLHVTLPESGRTQTLNGP